MKLHIPREDIVKVDSPAPRPTWFEDENIEPVFPATPMDEERESLFTQALNLIFPPAEAAETDDGFDRVDMDVLPVSKPGVKMAMPTSKPGIQMTTPTSKPTAKQRRVASGQDQDFSDASA